MRATWGRTRTGQILYESCPISELVDSAVFDVALVAYQFLDRLVMTVHRFAMESVLVHKAI